MVACENLESKYRCSTKVNGFEIVADATVEKGGQGEGFRPHDILECAYASCLNIFVRMLCEKMSICPDTISIKVNLNRLESKTVFKYSITFGEGISESQKQRVLNAVAECPIRKTLSKAIDFEMADDL